jgi:hypothetical protein
MFTPKLAISHSAKILRISHVCVWRMSIFLEHSIHRCAARWCLGPGERSLVSFHTIIATPIWTEPVRYWRRACRLACLHHTVLLQIIMAMSPTLHSIIVLADDRRGTECLGGGTFDCQVPSPEEASTRVQLLILYSVPIVNK